MAYTLNPSFVLNMTPTVNDSLDDSSDEDDNIPNRYNYNSLVPEVRMGS